MRMNETRLFTITSDSEENTPKKIKVVDPHVHLWDLTTGLFPGLETPSEGFVGNNAAIARTYPLEELLAEGEDFIEIVKIINIEAIASDHLAETKYLQKMADDSGYPQGIVVGADLSHKDIEKQLEQQVQYANVCGVRQILNIHSNPLFNYVNEDYMSNFQWQKNFRLLQKYNLSFDMQLYPHQMQQAAELVKKNTDTIFIINHAGMFVDRTLLGWKQWRDGMRLLSTFENVMVKISGLGMFDHYWQIESFRPYVLEILDAFGVERSMFASNFPVDKLFSTYAEVWGTFIKITECLADSERSNLFCHNAEKIYRI